MLVRVALVFLGTAPFTLGYVAGRGDMPIWTAALAWAVAEMLYEALDHD